MDDPWKCPKCGVIVVKGLVCLGCDHVYGDDEVDAEADTKIMPPVKIEEDGEE